MKKVILSTLVAGVAVLTSCNNATTTGSVIEGSPSVFDSLSYSLGANVGYTFKSQMSDIPFNFETMVGSTLLALEGKNDMTVREAMTSINYYFGEVRRNRAAIVAANRAKSDSIALANGATRESIQAANALLKADADMFESEAQREEISYAVGIDLGSNLNRAELPLHKYWLRKAIFDVTGGNAQMTDQESGNYLQRYFTVVRPAEYLKISNEKLAEIEKQSGVVKTESGLLYRIEVEGDTSIKATDDRDVVKVQYTGRLVRNDQVFDTSRSVDRTPEQLETIASQYPEGFEDDQPVEFPLNRVIPGWTEGMKLVGKGGRISLWIPANLAYGEQGTGAEIGVNDALFFDVEIVDVTPYTEVAEE